MLSETGFLAAELAEWSDSRSGGKGARCYVTLVEEMLSDGFTRHQKNDERVYGGRRDVTMLHALTFSDMNQSFEKKDELVSE